MRIVLSENVGPSPEHRGSDYEKRLVGLGHEVLVLPAFDYSGKTALGGDPEGLIAERRSLIRNCERLDALVVANTLSAPVGAKNNVSPMSLIDMGAANALHLPVVLTDVLPSLVGCTEAGLSGVPLAHTLAGNMILAVTGVSCGTMKGDFNILPDIVKAFDAQHGKGGQ